MGLREGNWHGKKEGTALAHDALYPDRSVVGFHNLLDQGQAQTRAPNMAGLMVLDAVKLAEQLGYGLRRDT